jgi:hypothetical protein
VWRCEDRTGGGRDSVRALRAVQCHDTRGRSCRQLCMRVQMANVHEASVRIGAPHTQLLRLRCRVCASRSRRHGGLQLVACAAAARTRRSARAASRAFCCRRGGVRAFRPRRRKGHRRGRRRRLGSGCAPRQRLCGACTRAGARARAHAAERASSTSSAAAARHTLVNASFPFRRAGMRYPDIQAEVGDTLVFNYMRMHDVRATIHASFRVHSFRVIDSRIHPPSCASGLVCGRHGLLLRGRHAAGGAGREPVPARAAGCRALHVFVQRRRTLRQRPGARACARRLISCENEERCACPLAPC